MATFRPYIFHDRLYLVAHHFVNISFLLTSSIPIHSSLRRHARHVKVLRRDAFDEDAHAGSLGDPGVSSYMLFKFFTALGETMSNSLSFGSRAPRRPDRPQEVPERSRGLRVYRGDGGVNLHRPSGILRQGLRETGFCLGNLKLVSK